MSQISDADQERVAQAIADFAQHLHEAHVNVKQMELALRDFANGMPNEDEWRAMLRLRMERLPWWKRWAFKRKFGL